MLTNFLVEQISRVPYQAIGGVPYSIWFYRVTWVGAAAEFKGRVGLAFPFHLDIKDPKEFRGVPAIQNTRLLRTPGVDRQHVARDITSPSATAGALEFVFLAPSAVDTFVPVSLDTQIPEAGSWLTLPYRTEAEGTTGDIHTMQGPAVVCAAAVSPPPTSQLDNSIRRIEKGTHVTLVLDDSSESSSELGSALLKYGYVRQLSLQVGEVRAVKDRIANLADGRSRITYGIPAVVATWIESFLAGASSRDAGHPAVHEAWDLLQSFEGSPLPSLLPEHKLFASVPTSALKAFGMALQSIRRDAADQAGTAGSNGATGERLFLLHKAAVANRGFTFNSGDSKVGMLNLERIEMAPAGIERGGLIATIPLAPLEETAVIQKEWSVTTKEFTSIVTDSLESVSETGVTDNTELSQSTNSQNQHANQFNITGTVTGGIPVIHGSASSTFGSQDSNSQSATESRKQAVALTQKASSRVKREHKVTISTTTVTGSAESTTRSLKNPSATDPIRIDYFSLMRKWQVRLFRYGLRLTYDIVIPEPGGALRAAYAELDDLKSKTGPFEFKLKHSDIRVDNYLALAETYGAVVPTPPDQSPAPIVKGGKITGLNGDSHVELFELPFEVEDGFWVRGVVRDAVEMRSPTGSDINFDIVGANSSIRDLPYHGGDTTLPPADLLNSDATLPFLRRATGAQKIIFLVQFAFAAAVQMIITIEPTPARMAQWKTEVWTALYNAAQTQYFALQQYYAGRIAELEERLTNVDSLTLRREESEEIMKGVLRFLLGVGFDFMPQDVINAIKKSGADVAHGVAFTGNSLGLDPSDLGLVKQNEDRVRFINEAIEWENVVSFLYSYFWDIPDSWEFIRQIQHPDALRQAFLRSGSARVVLTIRRGWEERWTHFVETLDPLDTGNSPYLLIAQEIAAYDDRNYPGIPPANSGARSLRLEDAIFTTSNTIVLGPVDHVEIEVASSAGFAVGAEVVVDSGAYADPNRTLGRQEKTTVTAIRDETHLTLLGLAYVHGQDGNGVPQQYDIMRPGEKGALIAEWFEYTPTSGTDIAVTSNLKTIA